MNKMMMTAAFALATLGTGAIAQTTGGMGTSGSNTGSGSMGSMGGTGTMGTGTTDGGMQSGTMNGGMGQPGMNGQSTNGMDARPMTKSQMAAMKKCQASTRAMKTKSCMKMQKMHPEMMNGSGGM